MAHSMGGYRDREIVKESESLTCLTVPPAEFDGQKYSSKRVNSTYSKITINSSKI